MDVKKIIIEATLTFNKNKIVFLRNFLPAVVTLLALGLGFYAMDIESKLSSDSPEFGYIPLILLGILSFFVILAKSIVHTHRTFILDEKPSIKALFQLTRRDFRFVKKFITLNLVMLLIYIVVMILLGNYLIELAQNTENEVTVYVIGLITALVTAFIWSRLAIVLPSAALDQHLSIQAAWKVSDDYAKPLFLGVGLLPVLTELVISFIPEYESYIYTVLVPLIWGVVAIIEVGILSLIYKEITEDQKNIA